MILPIQNPDYANIVIPLINEVKSIDNKPAYLNSMKNILAGGNSVLLVNVTDAGVADAFVFMYKVPNSTNKQKNEAFISLASTSVNNNDTSKEMWQMIEKWARLMECSTVGCFVDNKMKSAMIRKYGFNLSRTYLIKELEA